MISALRRPQAAPTASVIAMTRTTSMPSGQQTRADECGQDQRGRLGEIEEAAADSDQRLADGEHADDRHGEGDREHRLVRDEVVAVDRGGGDERHPRQARPPRPSPSRPGGTSCLDGRWQRCDRWRDRPCHGLTSSGRTARTRSCPGALRAGASPAPACPEPWTLPRPRPGMARPATRDRRRRP